MPNPELLISKAGGTYNYHWSSSDFHVLEIRTTLEEI
jgi:hypothetical protein